ncbi:MAG: RNA recognition motif-containing protein [Chloroflexi bacterium]|jgi:RNA recognition motif-containing protein|nr:MAG: RNA recognition motif-containing protein [Chloroflexota bacterium]
MRIYVGNLSYETQNADLERSFLAFGAVESAQVIMDRDSGRSKGFGFVEMPDLSEAQNAITGLNGKDVNGRSLTVNEAKPREQRASGGASGGQRSDFGGQRNERRW